MFKETKIGQWMQSKIAKVLNYIANLEGSKGHQSLLDEWKNEYPEMVKKIDEIELRLNNLEAKNGTKIIRQKSK
jgi:hypothetical protein